MPDRSFTPPGYEQIRSRDGRSMPARGAPVSAPPPKQEEERPMLELTSHLRPVRDTDQEEPEKEEKPPDERERAYITIRKREGLTEEQARQEFAKFDPGSRFHVRLAARERYAQEEAAAVTAEKQKRDEALSRIPEHYRSDWERRGLSLEEQKAAAKYIPESRLLPEEGKE